MANSSTIIDEALRVLDRFRQLAAEKSKTHGSWIGADDFKDYSADKERIQTSIDELDLHVKEAKQAILDSVTPEQKDYVARLFKQGLNTQGLSGADHLLLCFVELVKQGSYLPDINAKRPDGTSPLSDQQLKLAREYIEAVDANTLQKPALKMKLSDFEYLDRVNLSFPLPKDKSGAEVSAICKILNRAAADCKKQSSVHDVQKTEGENIRIKIKTDEPLGPFGTHSAPNDCLTINDIKDEKELDFEVLEKYIDTTFRQSFVSTDNWRREIIGKNPGQSITLQANAALEKTPEGLVFKVAELLSGLYKTRETEETLPSIEKGYRTADNRLLSPQEYLGAQNKVRDAFPLPQSSSIEYYNQLIQAGVQMGSEEFQRRMQEHSAKTLAENERVMSARRQAEEEFLLMGPQPVLVFSQAKAKEVCARLGVDFHKIKDAPRELDGAG